MLLPSSDLARTASKGTSAARQPSPVGLLEQATAG